MLLKSFDFCGKVPCLKYKMNIFINKPENIYNFLPRVNKFLNIFSFEITGVILNLKSGTDSAKT